MGKSHEICLPRSLFHQDRTVTFFDHPQHKGTILNICLIISHRQLSPIRFYTSSLAISDTAAAVKPKQAIKNGIGYQSLFCSSHLEHVLEHFSIQCFLKARLLIPTQARLSSCYYCFYLPFLYSNHNNAYIEIMVNSYSTLVEMLHRGKIPITNNWSHYFL